MVLFSRILDDSPATLTDKLVTTRTTFHKLTVTIYRLTYSPPHWPFTPSFRYTPTLKLFPRPRKLRKKSHPLLHPHKYPPLLHREPSHSKFYFCSLVPDPSPYSLVQTPGASPSNGAMSSRLSRRRPCPFFLPSIPVLSIQISFSPLFNSSTTDCRIKETLFTRVDDSNSVCWLLSRIPLSHLDSCTSYFFS